MSRMRFGLLVVVLAMPACAIPNPPPPINRTQFAAKVVVGMSEAEVIAAVGQPQSTTLAEGWSSWVYRGVVDPVTGRSGDAFVNFRGGRVHRVFF